MRRIGFLVVPALVAASVIGLVPAMPGGGAEPAQAATRRVSAWLPYWDQARGYDQVMRDSDLYSEVSPFWYEMRSASSVVTYENAEDAAIVSGLQSKGIKVIPTISNDFDGARVATMLASPANRTVHVQTVAAIVTSKGYDGIDIDYENLAAGDRDRFTAFIQELAGSLHAAGKVLTIAVHPKTSEPGPWAGPQAQNYAALGLAVDRVRVMAYDFHWATSAPGAIAPLQWVKDVAAFSASQIAPAKVQLGMPFYGYDWIGSNGEGVTYETAEARRLANGGVRQWSAADSAPWYTYSSGGSSHTVWYEDAQSIAAKLPVVDTYGLGGAVFWRLGGEDPAIWTEVRARFGSGTTPTPTPDVTAPTAPSTLTATGGRRSVTLTWGAATDAVGVVAYDVYRSSTATGTFVKIASATSTSYKNGNLAKGAKYWYQVRARDAAGNLSLSSNTASAAAR